jgi:signal transduction histidine kinase/CheY-like chemotaxis protein
LLLLVLIASPASPAGLASESRAIPAISSRITSSGEFYSVPEALRHQPHDFEIDLTVLYYDPHWKLLWARDRGGDSYWPLESTSPNFRSGQRILVSGKLIPALGLPLATASIAILADETWLEPLPTAGHFAEAERFRGRRVTAEAFVNAQAEIDANHLQLDLAIEGRRARAYLFVGDDSPIPQVAGAFVRINGVYVTEADPQFNTNVWVPRADDLVVIGWLDRDPRFALPATSVDQLASAAGSVVRVVGEVHLHEAGGIIVLRDATGQVTLHTPLTQVVEPGARIEAVGTPVVEGIATVLQGAIFRVLDRENATPPTGLPLLRLADQIRQLSHEASLHGYAVRLSGVVVWSYPGIPFIYLLDSSGGVALKLSAGTANPPSPGTRIAVAGKTIAGSFAPAVQAETIIPAEHIRLPDPRSVTLEQAMTGVEESQWIALTGYTRTVEHDREWSRLHISTVGGDFEAIVPRSPRIDTLPGAVVRVRGVCRAVTDSNRQLTRIELWIPGPNDIEIEEPSPADPFLEPLRSIASLRRFNPLAAFNRRVRVAGVVLHHEPGAYIRLQEEQQSLTVLSRDTTALQPGERIEAVGFPGRQGTRLVLREAQYRRIDHTVAHLPPLTIGSHRVVPELDGRLVRIEATVVDVSPRDSTLHLLCQLDGALFEAIGSRTSFSLPDGVASGCRAALTGVYLAQSDQAGRPVAFHLQLRSGEDLQVLRPAPWWTAGRTRAVLAFLALTVLAGLAWVFALRRRVRHQTGQIREELLKSSRLEAELVRTSRLESLGVLAGGIAHDFNNLLTVILGNLSLVINDRNVTEDDERCLRQSERAAIRARDLTQQLLTFSKGGAPVRSAVLLPDIVRESAGFALHGSRVRCEFDLAPHLWPAHVDRGQISQVVQNIVINAMHAMPAGGIIRISLRNEEVSPGAPLPLEPGRYLRLCIQDSGTGISPDFLPHIFDPFFTTKQKGNGLGLATVHSIVRKHGGHISVESDLGRGTTFHLWLPAAAEVTQSAIGKSTPRHRLSGRALVMDDEPPVRDMAAEMLRRLGLEVTVAADGAAAIDAYVAARSSGRPFSLVLLDLTVPGGMGGKEVLAELLKIDPSVRAIVSSGYSNDPVIAHYREHGFQARVPKPYEFEQLAAAVTCIDDSVTITR